MHPRLRLLTWTLTPLSPTHYACPRRGLDLPVFIRAVANLIKCVICSPRTFFRLACAAWRCCCPSSLAARRYNRQCSLAFSASWIGASGGESRGTAKVSPLPCMSMESFAQAAQQELAAVNGRGAAGTPATRSAAVTGKEGDGGGSASIGSDGEPMGATAAVESVVERVLQQEEDVLRMRHSPSPQQSPLAAAAGSGLRRPRPPPLAVHSAAAGMASETDADMEEVVREVRASERKYSYASLNEHQLTLSLRRSMKRRDWACAASILLGWVLNWFVFLGLLFLFSTYGCAFYARYAATDTADSQQLLLSWLWSVGMRFLINEPFLICASKGLPMLFTSAFCANFCSESIVACLALIVEGVLTFLKSLKP